MNEKRRYGSVGFTLIELLAVLAIMGIISAIGLMSYTDMMRGSGMRAAVESVSMAVTLARQVAVMQGRRSYVFFDYDDLNNNSIRNLDEPYYFVSVMREGSGIPAGARTLVDRYSDLSSFVLPDEAALPRERRPFVYNMTQRKSSRIESVSMDPVSKTWSITTYDPIWTGPAGTILDYGLETGPKAYLPVGFSFRNLPDQPLIFDPDGSMAGSATYNIVIVEDARSIQDASSRVSVHPPSGFVRTTLGGN